MGRKDVATLFTRADYERLPEGFPAQLIEGELVRDPSPSYGHQRIATEFFRRFLDLVGSRRVPLTPMDVGLDDHNGFQPDVVVRAVPGFSIGPADLFLPRPR